MLAAGASLQSSTDTLMTAILPKPDIPINTVAAINAAAQPMRLPPYRAPAGRIDVISLTRRWNLSVKQARTKRYQPSANFNPRAPPAVRNSARTRRYPFLRPTREPI